MLKIIYNNFEDIKNYNYFFIIQIKTHIIIKILKKFLTYYYLLMVYAFTVAGGGIMGVIVLIN